MGGGGIQLKTINTRESGDTTPCEVTPVILHGVEPPERAGAGLALPHSDRPTILQSTFRDCGRAVGKKNGHFQREIFPEVVPEAFR
jgi:hypothetical protein